MKDYSSPLSTVDITTAAQGHPLLSPHFIGVFPLDAIETLSLDSTTAAAARFFVYNTAPSYDPPGRHWIGVWVVPGSSAEIIDSLGDKPAESVISFLLRHVARISYSKKAIQNPFSSACGLYCLSYALARARGQSMMQWLQRFGSCGQRNDAQVQCEFMKAMAVPSMFHPRLRNWKRVVRRACYDRRRCRQSCV